MYNIRYIHLSDSMVISGEIIMTLTLQNNAPVARTTLDMYEYTPSVTKPRYWNGHLLCVVVSRPTNNF